MLLDIQFFRYIAGVIFIMIMGLGIYISFIENYPTLLSTKEQHEALLKKLKSIEFQLSQVSEYRTQLNQANKNLANLPEKSDFPLLLDGIVKEAEKNGLIFLNLSQESPVKEAFYTEMPVRMVMSGTYAQLLQMLMMMSTSRKKICFYSKAFSITRLKPATIFKNKEAGNGQKLLMNASLTFYHRS